MTEIDKLKQTLALEGVTFRERYTTLVALRADKHDLDQFDRAEATLKESVDAWETARNAALKNQLQPAREHLQTARELLVKAVQELNAIGQSSAPANQPSSPEPTPPPTESKAAKQAPSTPKPTPPSPKNDDENSPAAAEEAAAKAADNQHIDLEAVKNRNADKRLHEALGQKFEEIDGRFNALSGASQANERLARVLASEDFTDDDILQTFKMGRWLNRKKFTRNGGKHTGPQHDDEQQDDHSGHPADEHSDPNEPHPPTKAINLEAGQQVRPKPERN